MGSCLSVGKELRVVGGEAVPPGRWGIAFFAFLAWEACDQMESRRRRELSAVTEELEDYTSTCMFVIELSLLRKLPCVYCLFFLTSVEDQDTKPRGSLFLDLLCRQSNSLKKLYCSAVVWHRLPFPSS